MNAFASVVILALAVGASAAQADVTRNVKCESPRNSFWSCYTGARFDQIEVIEQLSAAPCLPGQSFGYERGSVWVDNGCRAVFRLTKFSDADSPRRVHCESRGYGRTDCLVGEYVGVDLFAELSQTACQKDYNWGYEPSTGYLWVTLGCRAVFSIY